MFCWTKDLNNRILHKSLVEHKTTNFHIIRKNGQPLIRGTSCPDHEAHCIYIQQCTRPIPFSSIQVEQGIYPRLVDCSTVLIHNQNRYAIVDVISRYEIKSILWIVAWISNETLYEMYIWLKTKLAQTETVWSPRVIQLFSTK